MMSDSLEARLEQFVGVTAEPQRVARYPVNEAMILNWVEAHDDFNPVYVDREVAKSTGRREIVCPPAMISTWVMGGYRRYRAMRRMRADGAIEDFAYSRLMNILDAAGYTSVVATNVEQEYFLELHPGDFISASFTIEAISPLKRTGLGEGVFITLLKQYRNWDNHLVVEERFRLLRFAPEAAQDDAHREKQEEPRS